MTPEEKDIFEQARRGDLNAFTERFFRLPRSGTRFTTEDRVEQYEMLYDAWKRTGEPGQKFEVLLGETKSELVVEWDPHYQGYPVFLLPHGFLMLPWISELVSPRINLGLSVTGTGTGKTCAIAVAMLAYAALYPGSRWLNVAPTSYQASLMLGEIDKWCAIGSPFRRFIKKSRGVHDLWVERPYPVVTVEVYPGFSSTFICQTVGYDASGILGIEVDWLNCDEAGLLENIEIAEHKLSTRLRGTRATGDMRWGKLTWITNPHNNPELEALISRYRDLMEKGASDILVLEGINSSANIYVTEWQLEKQRRLMNTLQEERWMGGEMSAAFSGSGIDTRLLDKCIVEELDYSTAYSDDIVGLRRFSEPREPGHAYVVVGDPGEGTISSLSTMNIPVVMVFDVTDFLVKDHGIKMVALDWMDGGGSYTPWIDSMKEMMSRYRATGYYDAGNVQSAFEDLVGAFGEEIWRARTFQVFFSGTISIKRWAVAILKCLMDDKQFGWPYIKGLWHQARIFDPSKKNRVDDLIAALLVLCRAFQLEDVYWSRLVERYKFDSEGSRDVQEDTSGMGPVEDDRYARVVA